MKKELKETLILGNNPFGVSHIKRTRWTIFKATIWLKWWDVRMFLAKHGLFVKKIKYQASEGGEEI